MSLPRSGWSFCFVGVNFPLRHDQSEALPRSGLCHVSSMEFLRSFLSRHFAGKPVVTSPNVGCFLASCNCKPGFVLNIIPSFLDGLRLEAVLRKSVILIQIKWGNEISARNLSFSGLANVSYLSVLNMANHLHICDGRVTLVAGQLFSI